MGGGASITFSVFSLGNSVSDAQVLLDNVTAIGNFASGNGGGVYVAVTAPVTTSLNFSASSLVLSDNRAYQSGGGVAFSVATLNTTAQSTTLISLADVTATNNSANSFGGGLYVFVPSDPQVRAVCDRRYRHPPPSRPRPLPTQTLSLHVAQLTPVWLPMWADWFTPACVQCPHSHPPFGPACPSQPRTVARTSLPESQLPVTAPLVAFGDVFPASGTTRITPPPPSPTLPL
jgi:hypothetical protein